MPEKRKEEIADAADLIVDGYAFQRIDGNIRVVNLNTKKTNVMIMTPAGVPLESDMDPIEQQIVFDIWKSDSEFMEGENAEVLSE